MQTFLQTKDWLEFQKSLGRKVWEFDDEKIKANIIEHDLPFGKNYLYIPHGPNFQFENIEYGLRDEISRFVGYLKNIGRENKSIFVKIEPTLDSVIELLYKSGFRKSNKEIQPKKTIVINLLDPEEKLLSLMHNKTRYNIRLAQKKNLVIRESDDVKSFFDLLYRTAKKDRFHTHKPEYYKNLLEYFSGNRELKTKLFFAYYQNRPIAGAIILSFGRVIYYLHGAMDRDYRSIKAPYLLQWEIMKYYKAREFQFYDLWGVDSRKWPGVTKFKIGFGGTVLERPGSFDLSVSGFWHLIYKMGRKVFFK